MAAELAYNTAELVSISSGRLLEDGKVVFAAAKGRDSRQVSVIPTPAP